MRTVILLLMIMLAGLLPARACNMKQYEVTFHVVYGKPRVVIVNACDSISAMQLGTILVGSRAVSSKQIATVSAMKSLK